jgi:bacterioferritin
MKGSKKVIDALNLALTEEMTAINQYIVHAEMAANWGYEKLHVYSEGLAVQEMKHAEKLVGRILFLEGTPIINKYNAITIGTDVPSYLKNDLATETDAVKMYNEITQICVAEKDQGTKEIVDDILREEEGHVNGLEERLDQIEQMGLGNFLSTVTA